MAPNSRFDREAAHGEDRYYHLVLLAENNEGYQNLMKIVSKGFVDGYYYKPRVDMEVLQQYHSGIIALSACLAGEVQRYLVKDFMMRQKSCQKYENCFGKGNFPGITGSWNPGAADGQSTACADEPGDRH